jgi:26S proteasome regulatory subunit N2
MISPTLCHLNRYYSKNAGRATNWAKFTAVASIGVVHKGHVHESMNLLQPYLPQGGQSSSPYSEAGALYALG